MNSIKVRYGSTVEIIRSVGDYEEASIIIGKKDEEPVLTKTVTVVDGIANLSLESDETEIEPDTYQYQINLISSDGNVLKTPEVNCDGDCELPQFEVCYALDEPVVS